MLESYQFFLLCASYSGSTTKMMGHTKKKKTDEMIKAIYGKPTTNIIFNSKSLKASPRSE